MNHATKVISLISVCLILFLINFDITATNLALSPISNFFHTNLNRAQWIISGYMLAAASIMILSGKLGDGFGRKKLFVIGSILFMLASAGIYYSHSINQLILFRVIQGLGMGVVYPQIIANAASVSNTQNKSIIMGTLTAVAGFAQALGPILGAWIIAFLSWRYIFLINIPICILAIALGTYCIKETKDTTLQKIDYSGAILLIAFITLSLYVINLHKYGLISIIIPIFALFIYTEIKHQNPLIKIQVFFSRNYLLNLLARLCFMIGFSGSLFTLGVYLPKFFKMPIITTSWCFFIITISFAIASLVAGFYVKKYQLNRTLSLTLLIMAISLSTTSFLNIHLNNPAFIITLVIYGISLGFAMTCTTTGAVKYSPENYASVASGIFFTVVFLSVALGVLISSSEHLTLRRFQFNFYLYGALAFTGAILALCIGSTSRK